MFKIYNNVEDKIVFHGNESDLIDFAILMEIFILM